METKEITTLFNISIDENGEIMPSEEFDPNAVGHLRPKLIAANKLAVRLSENTAQIEQRYIDERRRHFDLKNKLEEYLKDNAEEMDEEHLKGICEIFDIELNKTIEFVAQVEVKGTIEVPFWQTDDYFDEVTITANLDWGVDGEVTDATITEIEEA